MHGVAYDSKIEFVSFQNEIFNKAIEDQYASGLFSSEIEGDDARSINYLNTRVPVAFSANPGFYDWSDATPEEVEISLNNESWLSALRQTSTSAADRTVWVYAAGNYSEPYPSGAGYFPVHFPELSGHVIVAVALDSNGVIADYSNQCGAASTFCIAAPGRHYVPSGPNGYVKVQGTSLAAPTVGGSLAILKQAFPSLGNDELVTRLFATANKTGIYEVASIYGQGLVDLDAATQPVGQGQIPVGNSVNGKSVPMSLSTIQTAVPTGNAFAQGFAGRRVMILDELNTPFYVPFEAFVSTDNTPSSTSKKTRDLMNRLVHGTSQTHVNASPWLSIAGQPLAYRDSARKIESWFSAGNRDSFGFASRQSTRKKGKATISFTTGAMIEPQLSSRIDFSWGFRNDVSGYISDRNRGGASMRHMVVPGCRITGRFIDATGRRLDPIFDTDVCIIVQLASAQRDPRIRPLRRTVTTASSRIRVSRSCVSIQFAPRTGKF